MAGVFKRPFVTTFVLAYCWTQSLHADVSMVTTGNTGYVLHIQITPAVCELDENMQKQRKCLEGYAMTVSSLLPDTFHGECQTSTSAVLSPLQSKVVARLIPDESYRLQLWKAVGGCVGMNASQYFRSMTTFAQNLKIPTLLTDAASHTVTRQALQEQFVKLNNNLSADAIAFNCQRSGRKSLLTHISVCYKTNGQFKSCPAQVISSCPSNFNIQGTY